MFESRHLLRGISVGRTLTAGCALALAVGGCGGSSASKARSAPSVQNVIAAMNAQPRLIETLAGSSTAGRVIVDAKAGYLVLYSPSGKLTEMDKQGVEYRLLARGCYGRFWPIPPVNTRDFWLGPLREKITGTRYTTSAAGDTVTYSSSVGSVTVDARTTLIRSSFIAALPQGGVPAYPAANSYPPSVTVQLGAPSSATYSYPASVTELGAPSPLCH